MKVKQSKTITCVHVCVGVLLYMYFYYIIEAFYKEHNIGGKKLREMSEWPTDIWKKAFLGLKLQMQTLGRSLFAATEE